MTGTGFDDYRTVDSWWHLNEKNWPRVATLARSVPKFTVMSILHRRYLIMQLTTASVERLFSKMGCVVQKRLNRMLPARAAQRCCLGDNIAHIIPIFE